MRAMRKTVAENDVAALGLDASSTSSPPSGRRTARRSGRPERS